MATETIIQREAPEIEAYKLGLLQSAKALADQPMTLPTQQVADMSGLQQAAIQAASPAEGGIGGYMSFIDAAAPLYQQGASAVTGEQIQQYMTPFQQALQDEINRSFDIQSAQAGLQAVGQPGGPSAFGGSRAAVQQSEIDRNRASTLAQSQAQNFMQAQQAAERENARRMQAGLGIAQLGELAQQSALRDIQTQFDLGRQQQALQQAELEAGRQSELAQLYEPYQRFSFLSDIYRGAPSTQQTIASSTAPNVSPAQTYLGLGIAGLSAAAGAQKAGLFG